MREMPAWHFEGIDKMKVVLWVYYGLFISYSISRRTLLYDALICSDQKRLRDNCGAIFIGASM
jgi:hypothetical protein